MVTIHIALIIIAGLTVLYSDEQGLEWFRGTQKTLSKKRLSLLHSIVSLGLAGIILTGGLVLINEPEFLADPAFIAKMAFVTALTINGLFIGSLTEIATQKEFANVSRSKKRLLIVSGAISAIGWVGAIICGLLLG